MTESSRFFTQTSMVFYQPVDEIWLALVDMHSYWKWNPILKDVRLPNGLLYCAPIIAKYSIFTGESEKKGRINKVEDHSMIGFSFYRYHHKLCSENWQIELKETADGATEVSLQIGYSGWFSASTWQHESVAMNVACDVFLHALKQKLEEE